MIIIISAVYVKLSFWDCFRTSIQMHLWSARNV